MSETRGKRGIFFSTALILLLFNSSASGAVCTKFQQPNDTTFYGHYYGNEFLSKLVTTDGYTCVYDAGDGYYYYAVLDGAGDFARGTLKVGIDQPDSTSYGLERDSSIINAAIEEWEEFNNSIPDMEPLQDTTISLLIILAQFQDVSGDPNYTNSSFDSMLFTNGVYNTQKTGALSPDGDTIFGSFKDYFSEVSYGNVTITGTIADTGTADNTPTWFTLPLNKDQYSPADTSIYSDACSVACAEGIDTSAYEKIGVVYAGEPFTGYLEGTAHPLKKGYQTSERTHLGRFAHIGVHCHEFGHLIGFKDIPSLRDLYVGDTKIGSWSLMAHGKFNGPDCSAECPAHMNPYFKHGLGWTNPDTVYGDLYSQPLKPSELFSDSSIFVLPDTANGIYFYLENRQYLGFDQYLPGHDDDDTCGLLVWAVDLNCLDTCVLLGNLVDLYPADGIMGSTECRYGGGDKGDPYDGFIPEDSDTVRFEISAYTAVNNTNTKDVTDQSTVITYLAMRSAHPHPDHPCSLMVADFHYYWNGHISSDATWSGLEIIAGDVVIDSGVTLTIDSGTVVKFLANKDYIKDPLGVDTTKCELIVKGKLVVNGDSNDSVAFTSTSSTPSDTDWYGIRVLNTAGASAIIEYANIKHAYCGIHFANSASDTVTNCHLLNNGTYAVKTENSNLVITNNLVEDGCSTDTLVYGIYSYQASPTLKNNEIKDCKYGIYLHKGAATVDSNKIVGCEVGLRCYWTNSITAKYNCFTGGFADHYIKNTRSTLNLDSCYMEGDTEDLTPTGVKYESGARGWIRRCGIFHYDDEGLYTSGTSTPNLSNGYNSIFSWVNNSLQTAIRNMNVGKPPLGGPAIDADRNWWGTAEPEEEENLFVGPVLWQLCLTDSPAIYDACAGFGGSPKIASVSSAVKKFSLSQNYPNPFNPTTVIQFTVRSSRSTENRPVHTNLTIYNILGQKVKIVVNEVKYPGAHQVLWDGKDEKGQSMASGIYFYRVKTEDYVEVKKMVLLK